MLSAHFKFFKYDGSPEPQLSDLSFQVEYGDILWVQAATGSGKTTLLKILAGILPEFEPCEYQGHIIIDDTVLYSEQLRRLVTFCFQLPEYQFLFDTVRRQFIRSSMGDNDLAVLCAQLRISELLDLSVKDISTGQRKLVAVAAAIWKQRKVRLFDEPTANLDPISSENVLNAIQQTASGCMTVIASHDDRVKSICSHSATLGNRNVARSPAVEEWLKLLPSSTASDNYTPANKDAQLVFHCTKVSYTYPNGITGLKPISLSISRGEIIHVFGNNGSGKTTFIRILRREIQPSSGEISVNNLGKCGVVFQENERQLFAPTVMDELMLGIRGKNRHLVRLEVETILHNLGLAHRAEMHPMFLSGGEKKKVLIAAVLLCKPDTLILDEPFAGMDTESIEQTAELLYDYQRKTKMTLILIDHKTNPILTFVDKRIVVY